MKKKLKNLLLLFFILGIFLYLLTEIYHFILVEHCLDHGGRWDYDRNICILIPEEYLAR
jgi:hypothetical protein